MSNPPMVPENAPVTTRRPPQENKKSLLLSNEENQSIFDILGKGRQTLSTAVAQLLVPTPDQQRWQVKDTGALCLVRDTTKRSYFIQAISLRTKSMVFRQEVYNQFDYLMPQPWFITFEGDSSMVGINFADRVEAANFKEVLDNKLESKRQRRNERRSRVIENQHVPNPSPHLAYAPSDLKVPNGTGTTITSTYTFPMKKDSKKVPKTKAKDKKKLFRKEDIGIPMNFRHVQHVGWDPNRGFDLNGVDKDFQAFFQKAGVSHNQLEDEGTREFIYNFIESHGGVEAIKQDINTISHVAPPPPPMSHGAGNNFPPPPVPARHPSIPSVYPTPVPGGKSAAPPPPPTRPVPMAPSAYPGGPPPPPTRTLNSHQTTPSKISHCIGNGTAPPPPPPPPMGAGIPPPPPLIPSYGQGDTESDSGLSNSSARQGAQVESEDERSALMKQIQRGVSLKKIDHEQAKKPSGTLSDCLNQIKTGVDLKRVPESSKQSAPVDAMDGLAGALARALAERSRAINPDSSDSDADEEEPFDEDEWD